MRTSLALATALAATGCSSGDRVDADFNSTVARPAYADHGPSVLFDEAHHNVHVAGKSYRPFVDLIESDGYRVSRQTTPVTAGDLAPHAVFVIAAALGDNDVNDAPAFDEVECDVIRDWVAGGGALLFIVDHFPVGDANQRLASRLGVRLGTGVAEDSVNFDTQFDPTHVVFSRDNGGLRAHPIVDGRRADERIGRVLTLTGTSLYTDAPATGFLALGASAYARPPRPQIERTGGDVVVRVGYGDPVAVPGGSQGLAMEFGRGRIVVLGEAAMLTARLHRFDGRRIGMNTPGYDNRQLALNVMHWLTRLI